MAEVNLAWRVLGDPTSRRRYDDDLAGRAAVVASASPTSPPPVRRRFDPLGRYQDPPRVPWRPLLVVGVLGAVAVIGSAALEEPPGPVPVDNLLEPGSCVAIEDNGDAAEVTCDGPHDGVLSGLVDRAEECPAGTEPHRDRQGLGIACVVVGRI